jgi:hypothetical protein
VIGSSGRAGRSRNTRQHHRALPWKVPLVLPKAELRTHLDEIGYFICASSTVQPCHQVRLLYRPDPLSLSVLQNEPQPSVSRRTSIDLIPQHEPGGQPVPYLESVGERPVSTTLENWSVATLEK